MAITASGDSTPTTNLALHRDRSRRGRSAWQSWRSRALPAGGGRLGLCAVAALAALIFTWGAFHTATNDFYAADARSMSVSWKNFLYGAFDPAGSVTIDKLWGFLWPQALSVKLFGYHAWALALPEAIEGVVTVLVLHRLVRRVTGRTGTALLAALIFTLTPIVASTFGHSGLEDNALTMLLVLATDAFQRAVAAGRPRSLLLSGFWVGLAFQTKMVQAWTVVPVFALIYLLCAPHGLAKRVWHTALGLLATLASSLWLMVIVQLTPAQDRPYVDGSSGTNNIFKMVFEYNFTSRFGSLSGSGGSGGVPGGGPGGNDWTKLFGASFGSQIGWLYPLALIALCFALAKRRGAGRTDPERAGYLVWGGTLLVTGLAFSAGTIPHSQYMAVLAPSLAALSAVGIIGLHRAYVSGERAGWLLLVAIAATVAWATYLSYENTLLLSWLPPLVIVLGLAAIALLLAAGRVRRTGRGTAFGVVAGTVLGTVAMIATPAAWALSTFETQYDGTSINAAAGPYSGQFGVDGQTTGRFGGPGAGGGPPSGPGSLGGGMPSYGGDGPPTEGLGGEGQGMAGGPGAVGSPSMAGGQGTAGGPGTVGGPGTGSAPGGTSSLSSSEQQLLTYLRDHQGGAKYLMAVMSSGDAESYIADAGASVLPVGGFSGADGYPSLRRFKALVASGELRYVLLSGAGAGSRPGASAGAGSGPGAGASATSTIESWVRTSCTTVSASSYGGSGAGTLYSCTSG